jgi:hypothetical protein
MNSVIELVKNNIIPFVLGIFRDTKKFLIFSAVSSAFTYGIYFYYRNMKNKKLGEGGPTKKISVFGHRDMENIKLQMRYPGLLSYENMNSSLYELRRMKVFEMNNNFNLRKFLNNKNMVKQDQVFFNIFQKMAVYAMKTKFA